MLSCYSWLQAQIVAVKLFYVTGACRKLTAL